MQIHTAIIRYLLYSTKDTLVKQIPTISCSSQRFDGERVNNEGCKGKLITRLVWTNCSPGPYALLSLATPLIVDSADFISFHAHSLEVSLFLSLFIL